VVVDVLVVELVVVVAIAGSVAAVISRSQGCDVPAEVVTRTAAVEPGVTTNSPELPL